MSMGLIRAPQSDMPTIDDAKPAYIGAANRIGLTVTKFEEITGQWEWDRLLYRMDVAVEGVRDDAVYEHVERIRFHKTTCGWYIELPVFRLCGLRKNIEAVK
jgi:hypothetical protein